MKVDVIYDSQSVDMEIKLRNRTTKYYHVFKKSEMSRKSIVQVIDYDIDVNDETHKIEEMYTRGRGVLEKIKDRLTGRRFTLDRKRYYHLFDSWYDDFDYPMTNPDDKFGYDSVMRSQKMIPRKIRK